MRTKPKVKDIANIRIICASLDPLCDKLLNPPRRTKYKYAMLGFGEHILWGKGKKQWEFGVLSFYYAIG